MSRLDSSIVERIRDAKEDYISASGVSPSFLLMSVNGYNELLHTLGNDSDDPDFFIKDFNNHLGLEILVSQNIDFKDFILK